VHYELCMKGILELEIFRILEWKDLRNTNNTNLRIWEKGDLEWKKGVFGKMGDLKLIGLMYRWLKKILKIYWK